jgi:hypothetical protein
MGLDWDGETYSLLCQDKEMRDASWVVDSEETKMELRVEARWKGQSKQDNIFIFGLIGLGMEERTCSVDGLQEHFNMTSGRIF